MKQLILVDIIDRLSKMFNFGKKVHIDNTLVNV